MMTGQVQSEGKGITEALPTFLTGRGDFAGRANTGEPCA